MNILFFSSQKYDEEYFTVSNQNYNHNIRFVKQALTCDTVNLIHEESVVCVFVNDHLDQNVIVQLVERNVKMIALRCAGFNNVDVDAAHELGLIVVRVPAYSPSAVAEHAICLMFSLNRKINHAHNRVREGNFSLNGLLGFDFSGKTIGIIGTGKIGEIAARITSAMGMHVVAHDPVENSQCIELGVKYVSMKQLLKISDIITLHCPLKGNTKHLIGQSALSIMKQGVMLINTSRGDVLDTTAVIKELKSKKIGYLGLDVYEQESELFFKDRSTEIIQDDVFERLLTFPNVIVTAHQGFFTSNALKNIADTTLKSIQNFENANDLTGGVLVS